jgi:hypothetical protein
MKKSATDSRLVDIDDDSALEFWAQELGVTQAESGRSCGSHRDAGCKNVNWPSQKQHESNKNQRQQYRR